MIYLNLSYFNTIKGPQVLCTFPEDLNKEKTLEIANLLNISELVKQKFFVYDISEFKTINHYFEIPSEWARGKKEMLLLSIIVVNESVESGQEIEKVLETIAKKISDIDKAFMGFYTYDWEKAEDYDEVDENNEKIINIIKDSLDLVKKTIKEVREKAIQRVLRSFEPKELGTYIMDAKVFENLYKVENNKEVFEYLNRIIVDGIRIYITEEILPDIHLPNEILNTFLSKITIYHIPESALKRFIKSYLDPRYIINTSILSLLVLAEILNKNKDNQPVTIVTNDYKLSRLVKSHLQEIKVLPASAFFLEIINVLKNKELRDYFQKLRKKMLDYEMEILFQTKQNISNPKEQLSWLIEKAIGVAGRSIVSPEQEDMDEKIKFSKLEASLINLFIQGVKLASNQIKTIEKFIPFLSTIAKANFVLNEIQMNLVKDEMDLALEKIHKIIAELQDTLLLSGASLKFPDNIKFSTIITKSLANFEFLASICHTDLGELDQSIEHLSMSSIFSLLANRPNNVIISHYLESLTLVYTKRYDQAIRQFEITQELSEKYNNSRYVIMSLGGKAISEFLKGDEEGAKSTMTIVNKHIKEKKDEAIIILNEFGDTFYNMGHPDIAIHFYNEAIEISIALANTSLLNVLFSKLKKCFYSVGSFDISPLSKNIHKIIDQAYELKDSRAIEIYNTEISKMGEIQRLLNEPFPYLTQNQYIKGTQIDPIMLDWMDLLHVSIKKNSPQKNEYETNFFCLHPTLGGIVIRILEKVPSRFERTPEIYKISLKGGDEKYKIIEADKEYKEKFLVRAIILTDRFNNIILKRMFSPIFGKFFEP
ncbi:MAG: tetratricopeptide repeat protein [Candidatus Helarchaeota archaeon]